MRAETYSVSCLFGYARHQRCRTSRTNLTSDRPAGWLLRTAFASLCLSVLWTSFWHSETLTMPAYNVRNIPYALVCMNPGGLTALRALISFMSFRDSTPHSSLTLFLFLFLLSFFFLSALDHLLFPSLFYICFRNRQAREIPFSIYIYIYFIFLKYHF